MQQNKHLRKSEIFAIDLFCGAGGLMNGLRQAGIRVPTEIDIDKTCKYFTKPF